MPDTILVTESSNFSQPAAKCLQQAGRVIWADLDRPGLISAVTQATVLWVRLRHHIDREVFAAAPHLRAIATPTTGLNHIDVSEAERRGIRILSLRGETAFLEQVYATGEHTLALILALLRHVPAASRHVTEGAWNRDSFRGRELHGKTAGIVGYGRLGRMVAGYLRALGMKILAADPSLGNRSADPTVQIVSLEELLAQSDLVTLHVGLAEQTRGFFGRAEFARMKRGSWFINTSRGELVDEAALLASLRNGRVGGAALDVLSGERSSGMSDHPLVAYARTAANLLITPHIGGCTTESMENTENFLAEKLFAFLQSPQAVYAQAARQEDHR